MLNNHTTRSSSSISYGTFQKTDFWTSSSIYYTTTTILLLYYILLHAHFSISDFYAQETEVKYEN